MKYFYLWWRHMFPRRRWTIQQIIELHDWSGHKCGTRYILQDQFGNLKVFESNRGGH